MITNLALLGTVLFAGAEAAYGGWNDEEDHRTYQVIVNHEEQYSIWFADREAPKGWSAARFKGSKRECLDHIEEVWTDMRPLSLRRRMGRWEDLDEERTYSVVVNHEEQYSIWFADWQVPAGWKDAGFRGTRKECFQFIEEVWTDMRPLSLRKYWKDE